jgi:DNA-binding response OmpR family regulator
VRNRILIIEDDTDLAHMMRLQLEYNDYRVTVCQDGVSGLQAVRESEPDLILLDILLPDVNGWAVCEELREITDVPIIIATALGTARDMIHGIRLGADDYMVKPFSYMELVARVETALYRAQRGASE